MSVRDLRDWIGALEKAGELVRVRAQVDPHLEITEIADRAMKSGGPALLFTNVKGSALPLLIAQFGSERRMCMALGVNTPRYREWFAAHRADAGSAPELTDPLVVSRAV